MAERKRRSERNVMAQGYVPQQPRQPQYQQQYQPQYQAAPYQAQYAPVPYQRKKSRLLLISGIIALAYLVYIIGYMISTSNNLTAGNTAESLGAAIGTSLAMAMITPHVIAVVIAFIFNALAWALSKPGFALTAGILYAVAAVLMFVYAFFVLPSLVLSFVGYAKLKRA